jgi:tRNA (adenine57-N1/adenine58-N1)-methyltransferase
VNGSASSVFAAGDRVLLVDNKKRRHLVTLETGGQFHTHAGIVGHDDLIGHPDGITVRTTPASPRCDPRWPSTCWRCHAARR